MISQVGNYWANVGIFVLSLCNLFLLMTVWDAAIHARKADAAGRRLKFFAGPVVLTVFIIAGFGMLALGRSPDADIANTKLHGDASPKAEAVEAELRQERELHLHTKQELVKIRKQLEDIIKKAERQQFESEVQEGEEHMLKRRRQLMERDKSE